MPAGRPTKYDPAFVEQARKLAALGATDREAAEFFDVNEATLHRWKHEHPEFCESLKVGKEQADARVEQSLYRRALGYTHDAVKIQVNAAGEITEVPFVERYPPDTTAAIFWLKNRKPEEWRDVKAQEHSGPGGAPIRTDSRTTVDVDAATSEQLRVLASLPVHRG
jgi:hypothetical protein